MSTFQALFLAFVLVISLAGLTVPSSADRGVGVNVGTIEVNDRLVRGGVYELPSVGVLNTGDEDGEYAIEIGYFADQSEKRTPPQWVVARPQRFFLTAGGGQTVSLQLSLPSGAAPGDYFALIEAHPLTSDGTANIGAAAATKLSFTVKPSGWFETLQVRINRLIDENEPWSYLLPILALATGLVWVLSRTLRVNLRIERRR